MQKHTSLLPSFIALALGAAAVAQDALYYKFDENGGKKVINYASGSGLAPTEGTIAGGLLPAFQAGRFGVGALSGGTAVALPTTVYVDTGWTPTLTNSDLTIAFFMKQRTAPPSTSYFYYSNSGFRGFTGGVAAKGLYFRNGPSGTLGDWILTTDIQTPAAAGWVHIALVVDATALTATYYINAVAQTPITITTGATTSGGNSFKAAGFATSYGGLYDIDEFRVYARAAKPAEIAAWSVQTSGADSQYGAGCNGATLTSSGGVPSLGNAAYAVKTNGGTAGSVALLGLGANRLSFFGVPLPLDLGTISGALTGCQWECSGDLFFAGVVLPGGSAQFPLPIPTDLALAGATLFTQALVITGGAPSQSTNGVSLGIGQ